MKYYNNSAFNAIIVILIFILNIKIIEGASIKCSDCQYNDDAKKCKKGSEDCPSYCRPHFFSEVLCYDCSDVFKNEKAQLYSIDTTNGKCVEKFQDTSSSDEDVYIISETNEFVRKNSIIEENRNGNGNGNILYAFGYFIYRACPDGTPITNDNNWYTCQCSVLTYSITIFGKILYKCVNSCPYGYNQYSNGIYLCIDTCSNKIIVSNNTCVSNCNNDKYYFSYSIENGNKYCSNRCPSSAPFYYPGNGNNEVACLASCNNKDFYVPKTKQCTEKCTDHKSLIDIDNSIFICDEELGPNDPCPASFPYKYKNSCLKKCSDTNNNYFLDSRHFNDLEKKNI